ncbi:hypothetical protein LZ198_25890 [Myxococcus sp. K15C18031901]|uniref:hypothetical protein n=1 Tax=Myxococcus dinghuensis TaxID=2906761 RepID=UPI0020A6DBE2|nr:hypothetical protein [Myxococcus dinghuensis]MCP3102307.1 hypothetical protein [Myxococcus dinghuensis]
MSKLRAMACVLALGTALAYTGCSGEGDPPHPLPDGGTDAGTDGGTDAGTDGGTTEFTTFVRGLILEKTTDTATPEKLDDKNLVDSEPVNAFTPSFFQR